MATARLESSGAAESGAGYGGAGECGAAGSGADRNRADRNRADRNRADRNRADRNRADRSEAVFVDGGIVGPPPRPGGAPDAPDGTRLYLSGERAAEIAELFAGTPVGARVVEGGVGAASAVKMAYAAWTKGTAALVLAVRALARADGVEDALLAEWAVSQPSLAGRSERAAESAAAKGWRWDAEMTEIAASMAAAGLPDGFHLAAAEIFRRVPRAESATVDEVPGGPHGLGGCCRRLQDQPCHLCAKVAAGAATFVHKAEGRWAWSAGPSGSRGSRPGAGVAVREPGLAG